MHDVSHTKWIKGKYSVMLTTGKYIEVDTVSKQAVALTHL